MLKLADMEIHIHYSLGSLYSTSHNQGKKEHNKWMYVALCCNGRGRKLMQVNRTFHYSLSGLQSTSCNEDESYNSEAAGRSFVLQYTHIIQPTPVNKSTAHTHAHRRGEFLEYELIRLMICGS